MNTGIVMIGLALVLLSVAFMISPSTAIVTGPADCSRCVGFAEDTISDYCSGGMTIPVDSSYYQDSIISNPTSKNTDDLPVVSVKHQSVDAITGNQPHILKTR